MTSNAVTASHKTSDGDESGSRCKRSIVSDHEDFSQMNEMLKPKIMLEATRLTRAGRLTDATALLQRMLRGETAPNMHFGGASDVAPAGRTRRSLTPRPRPSTRRTGRSSARPLPPDQTVSVGSALYSTASGVARPPHCRPRTLYRQGEGSLKRLTAIRQERGSTSSTFPATIRGRQSP